MLLETWRLVRRRWLVALPVLLLTASACLAVTSTVRPEYRATGQMLFLLPPQQPDPLLPPVNPYLNLSDGMSTTANLIAGMVTTKDVERSLADRGLKADYSVVLLQDSGPVLSFTTQAGDAATALETRDALMDMVEDTLADLQQQAGTPAAQTMTATRPTVSERAEVLRAPLYKALAAVLVAGLLVTVLLCLMVDRWHVRRARRRDASAASADAVGPTPTEDVRVVPGPTESAQDARKHDETEQDVPAESRWREAGTPVPAVETPAEDATGRTPAHGVVPSVRHRNRSARRNRAGSSRDEAAAAEDPDGALGHEPESLAG